MEPLKTVIYKEREIKIYQDERIESPREWNNLGKIVIISREYDERLNEEQFSSMEELKKAMIKTNNIPIFYDERIGLYISDEENCNGYIYVSNAMIIKEYGSINEENFKKARKCMKEEIKIYNKYIQGEVYAYTTDNDSCCGYYSIDDLLTDAKNGIDYDIEQERKNKISKTKQLVKNHVGLLYRK